MNKRAVGTRFLAVIFFSGTAVLGKDNHRRATGLRYNHKYMVVLKPGLAVGLCSEGSFGVSLMVKVESERTDYSNQGWHLPGCTGERVQPGPLHPGEVLYVFKAVPFGGELKLNVRNVSPHAVTRGVGAFQHESLEKGAAELRFKLPDRSDFSSADPIVEQWLKPFNSQEQAAQFGNTASGAFVKEIKLGMAPTEVEAVLGSPETRVDLGEKTLYKYKDMTVEFQGGKVSDLR
jgi:hypothetical protein